MELVFYLTIYLDYTLVLSRDEYRGHILQHIALITSLPSVSGNRCVCTVRCAFNDYQFQLNQGHIFLESDHRLSNGKRADWESCSALRVGRASSPHEPEYDV